MSYTEVFDTTTGTFDYTTKSNLFLRFAISGTPNANIKLELEDKLANSQFNYEGQSYLILKPSCSDWGTGIVTVSLKFNNPTSVYSETGDILSKNEALPLIF